MDRPVFNSIMDRIQRGESDGLIVYKVDRFARSVLGALTVLEQIASHGGTFASVSDNIDLTTAQGRAFLQMQLVFAELFREQIKESFNIATTRAVGRGIHISNQVPLGYDRSEDRLLVPNQDAAIVREIFQRRADGEGASAIARWLDQAKPNAGIVRVGESDDIENPDRRWTPARVRTLLGMRVYLGEAHYGNSRNPHAHEAIIDHDLFRRAQAAKGRSVPRGGTINLLAGLVRCSGCRYLMTPGIAGDRDHRTPVYRCRGRHTAGQCPAPATIVRARLERYVEEQLFEGAPLQLEGVEAETVNLEALTQLEKIREENDTLRAILGDGYAGIAEERERIEAAVLSELEGPASAAAMVRPDDWHLWPVGDRNDALRDAIDTIMVRKMPGKPPVSARTIIMWRGQGPDDLPRRGADNGPVRGFDWPEDNSDVAAA